MSKEQQKILLLEPSILEKAIDEAVTNSPESLTSLETRNAILAVLKDALKAGHTRAEELLLEDGDGRECARRLSQLQDTLIKAIYDFATKNIYVSNNRTTGEQLSILAVGGYGRGLLAPGSDIDLLFLLPAKMTVWAEQVIEYILYFLWDMGQKVGHSTRNLDEAIRQATADMTIRTAMLEARFIEGVEALFDKLVIRYDKEIVEKTANEFIAAKLEERDLRHSKTGESRYLVEPNVKDGKGGLRDLHTLYWIGKYYYRVKTYEELVPVGLFNQDEFNRFQKASDFLWTIRCHMHFLVGKAEERLSFDIQSQMAERLNYVSKGGMLDVERFMKHYFLVAKEVGDLTLAVCAQLEEDQAKTVTGINGIIRSIRYRIRRISGTLDFTNDHGRINVIDESAFERDPVNMIRLFKLADDNDLDIHPDVNTLITRSLNLVDRNLRNNDEANRLFVDIVCSRKNPEKLLRKMNETGLLGKFIPSFGKIVAMMQFNMYHHYTVDEHLIRSVGVLNSIENGKIAKDHPLSSSLLPEVKDRRILYVALLIHDIAKGRKQDHSIAGARIAKNLCPRLGFNKEDTELISWLVLQHLTMSLIAQSRDLQDRKTIKDFAEIVQSVERMRYLVILTVCDIRAVGPGVWNGWKGQLLRTLYYETQIQLTGGFAQIDQQGRIEHSKQILGEQLEGWSEQDKRTFIDLPYPSYFLATPIEDQVRHMNFIRKTDIAGDSLATEIRSLAFEAVTEITVLAPDHPSLLSNIAGACATAGANIVDAKIHTTKDGRGLDIIFINREFKDDIDEMRRAERLCETIKNAIIGKIHLPKMLANTRSKKASAKAFKINPKVSINNDLSEEYTVVEVEGLDSAGFLSTVAQTLSELSLNITSAQIATFGEKVVDNFYVTDLIGHKIMLQSRQQKIIDTLTQALTEHSKSVSS